MQDYFKNKNIAIVGYGITGQELMRFLIKQGAFITICDQKSKIKIEKKYQSKINLKLGKNYLKNLDKFDLIFISPGVPLSLINFKKIKNKINTDIKLFFDLCSKPIIGITGTNGKTTTTSLISQILKIGGKNVLTGGNIGTVLINQLNKINSISSVVLELSSFQLELLKKSPHIAVILNITPDHMDRYKNFSEYKRAKFNIVKYQNKQDYAILNYDDINVRKLKNKINSQVLFFSTQKILKRGAFLDNDFLVVKDKNKQLRICHRSEIKILGLHNLSNVLAAILVGYLLKIPINKIKKAIISFKGVEHRLEFVTQKNKVNFYNDSKATTPESTMAALSAFNSPVILIAGGYDKKANFKKLVKVILKKVKILILIGQTASKIYSLCRKENKKIPIYLAKTLSEAVKKAYQNSEKGDNILLSPACASYDMFNNFEERGKKFKEIVSKLK